MQIKYHDILNQVIFIYIKFVCIQHYFYLNNYQGNLCDEIGIILVILKYKNSKYREI